MTFSEESFRKLSCNVLYEEEGYGVDWTFHSRCTVREIVCTMSIDCESSINAASIELVEKLELPMTLHPQPYVLKWYSGVLKITNQVINSPQPRVQINNSELDVEIPSASFGWQAVTDRDNGCQFQQIKRPQQPCLFSRDKILVLL